MLYGVDFDCTLINGHTNNIICAACKKDPTLLHDEERQWQLVKDLPLIGTKEDWNDVFARIINAGHRCGIVSYSQFPHIILRVLKEKLALPRHILSQIGIVSFLPDEKDPQDKWQHFKLLLQAFVKIELAKLGYTKDKGPDTQTYTAIRNQIASTKDCILVDDDPDQIIAGLRKGIRVIEARADGSHLHKMWAIIPWNKLDQNSQLKSMEQDASLLYKIESLQRLRSGTAGSHLFSSFSVPQNNNHQTVTSQMLTSTPSVPTNTSPALIPTPAPITYFSISNSLFAQVSPLAYAFHQQEDNFQTEQQNKPPI